MRVVIIVASAPDDWDKFDIATAIESNRLFFLRDVTVYDSLADLQIAELERVGEFAAGGRLAST